MGGSRFGILRRVGSFYSFGAKREPVAAGLQRVFLYKAYTSLSLRDLPRGPLEPIAATNGYGFL